MTSATPQRSLVPPVRPSGCFRRAHRFQHFKKTLMAFVRDDDALEGKIEGGIVHTRHSGPIVNKAPGSKYMAELDAVEALNLLDLLEGPHP